LNCSHLNKAALLLHSTPLTARAIISHNEFAAFNTRKFHQTSTTRTKIKAKLNFENRLETNAFYRADAGKPGTAGTRQLSSDQHCSNKTNSLSYPMPHPYIYTALSDLGSKPMPLEVLMELGDQNLNWMK